MINQTIEDNICIAKIENGKANTLNFKVLETLKDIIKNVNNDDSLKGLIITGTGKYFTPGFDLDMLLAFKTLKEYVEFFTLEEKVLTDLFMCKKPVVSAINGHAIAGGLIISTAADYRIAKNHPKIKIGMTEIKIGLPLTIAQTHILQFGFDSNLKYRDIMYDSLMYNVNQAKDIRLIDEICEEDDLIITSKAKILSWIDTPNRPFIKLKYQLKEKVAKKIEYELKNENWHDELNVFFEKQTRDALAFVASCM